MKVPGIVYSLLLSIGAWATTYFATGNPGGDYVWAPILLAAVPVALKFVTVFAGESEPEAMSRSIGLPTESKAKRLLLG